MQYISERNFVTKQIKSYFIQFSKIDNRITIDLINFAITPKLCGLFSGLIKRTLLKAAVDYFRFCFRGTEMCIFNWKRILRCDYRLCPIICRNDVTPLFFISSFWLLVEGSEESSRWKNSAFFPLTPAIYRVTFHCDFRYATVTQEERRT